MSQNAAVSTVAQFRPASNSPGSAREVEVSLLADGFGLREKRFDENHLAALLELEGDWPPITIWGPKRMVIDGNYRVAAARRLGLAKLMAWTFSGSESDAFAESLRLNAAHGLPLTQTERLRAVTRVVSDHPEWSDRRIAAACGVSSATAAKARGALAVDEPCAPIHSVRRIGLDGRARPLSPAATRQRIVEALTAEPDASLREIAAIVGSSPETVRTMRRLLANSSDRDPICADRDLPSIPHADSCRPPKSSASGVVTIDAAILSSPRGDEFAEWFANTKISSEWQAFATSLPLSRVYVIADEALRRAREWEEFARTLHSRSDVPALEPPSVESKSTIRNRLGTHDASQNMRRIPR
jgi:hypothetical protein